MATTNKENRVKLDLGYKPFVLDFGEGKEPVVIRFNPADADLAKRMFEAQKRINAGVENLPDDPVSEDEVDPEKYVEARNALNKVVYDAIDYAFGAPISAELFKYCSPMASVNGKPFVFVFMEAITPEMEKIISAENKKSSAYVNSKYGKYLKK